jgi:uncharacterized DUF497 family protein
MTLSMNTRHLCAEVSRFAARAFAKTTLKRRLLVVSFAERGKIIRLISARKATRAERRKYEEEDLA